jgi:hypothetical protein
MGMYSELIFGAKLKEDTPDQVINALKYMIGELEEKPSDFPLPDGRCEWLLRSGSEYFPVNRPESSMWCDSGFFGETYHISTRSNIKNYGFEIDTFLEWIEPYIAGGSGNRGMFAIVIEEDASEPDIYYLDDYRDYK